MSARDEGDASGAGESATMEVTVVVPVYNAGALLAEQLDALQRQTFKGLYEVVLADNGCTDGCLDEVRSGRGGVPVRIVPATEKGGPSHARNTGAQAAEGEWLAFCDADDVAAPTWLDALHRVRHDFDLVAGSIEVGRLNPPEIVLARGTSQVEAELPVGPCRFLPYALSCNLFVRRSTFASLGGFEEDLPYDEDVDLSWRAQLAGLTLGMAPDATVHYRYRTSVRAVFRQMLNYGEVEALLYRRYRMDGARRLRASDVAHTVFWLLSRAPFAVMGLNRRYVWFKNLGGEVGRLKGSIRYRVWYP